jgi:glucosamine kinase
MSGVRVGVDGGQSRLRLAVSERPGAVFEAPGFSYHAGEPVAATVDAVRQAWAAAGVAEPVERAVLGLTGLPAVVELRDALAAGVARALAAREVVLCADNVTAHAGALPDGYGVALTVGTGVGCLAVDPATATIHRVDGWGHLYGDDGSAFAIGRAGIAAVLRAVDGRGPATALTAAAAARYGPAATMTQRLYPSARVVDDTARFAPDVVAAARAGDRVAAGIVAAAGAELARTASAGVAALPGTGAVPVTHTGRLVAGGGPLVDAFRAALATACPRAAPVGAAGSAPKGAGGAAGKPGDAYRAHLHVYRGS